MRKPIETFAILVILCVAVAAVSSSDLGAKKMTEGKTYNQVQG